MRRLLAVGLVGCAVVLGGCDAGPEPGPTATARQGVASLGEQLVFYCEVQALRELVRDGEVDQSQLPSWADRTVVDGTPRIVDFRSMPPEGFASRLDRLFASPGLRDVDVDVDQGDIRRCRAETTEGDVERTQDGPGYRAPL